MHWTDDKLRQVIAQHAPVLCLHKDEKYLPCSVEWYIEHSELWLQQPNESSQVASQSETYTACNKCCTSYTSCFKCCLQNSASQAITHRPACRLACNMSTNTFYRVSFAHLRQPAFQPDNEACAFASCLCCPLVCLLAHQPNYSATTLTVSATGAHSDTDKLITKRCFVLGL